MRCVWTVLKTQCTQSTLNKMVCVRVFPRMQFTVQKDTYWCWYHQRGWRVQCHIGPPQGWPRSLAACLFRSTTPGGFLCLFAQHHSNVCGPKPSLLIHFCHPEGRYQTGHTWLLFPQECWPPFHQCMWTSAVLIEWVRCLDCRGNSKNIR